MSEVYPFPWRFDRQRYSDLYLMRRVTEAEVQKDILELLGYYQVDGAAIDAGGRRHRGRILSAAKAAGASLDGILNLKTGRGIPAGFADLEATLASSGRSLYIEVKAPAWLDTRKKIIRAAGYPSAAQLEFLASKARRGALVLVAWAATDVERHAGAMLEMNRRALQ